MKTTTTKILTALLTIASLLSGCEKEEKSSMVLDKGVELTNFKVDNAQKVDFDKLKNTIVITYPSRTNVSAIVPTFTVPEGAQVTPAPGTPLDLRSTKTITIINGNVFTKYTVSANVLNMTGFLSHHPNVDAITDDDEAAYAQWFFKKYNAEVGSFVTFQGIKDGTVDLSKIKTLTWYVDEKLELPAIALDPVVLSKLTQWYKDGGNLYLLGFANQYFFEMGRMEKNKYKFAIGTSQGSDNPDTWAVSVNMKRTDKDKGNHALFAGISLLTGGDNNKYFQVISPGWKEDHNFVLEQLGSVYSLNNDDEQVYTRFTTENKVEWLGVWSGIGDYFMAGILEFLPKDDFKGRAIWQGIGGIEWKQNAMGETNPTGVNKYQGNIEKLAENAIRYLSAN